MCVDCADGTTPPAFGVLIAPPRGALADAPIIGGFSCYHCSRSARQISAGCIFTVKSLTAKDWTDREVMAMEIGGNKNINAMFEANLQAFSFQKPSKETLPQERDAYVKAKYELRLLLPTDPKIVTQQYRSIMDEWIKRRLQDLEKKEEAYEQKFTELDDSKKHHESPEIPNLDLDLFSESKAKFYSHLEEKNSDKKERKEKDKKKKKKTKKRKSKKSSHAKEENQPNPQESSNSSSKKRPSRKSKGKGKPSSADREKRKRIIRLSKQNDKSPTTDKEDQSSTSMSFADLEETSLAKTNPEKREADAEEELVDTTDTVTSLKPPNLTSPNDQVIATNHQTTENHCDDNETVDVSDCSCISETSTSLSLKDEDDYYGSSHSSLGYTSGESPMSRPFHDSCSVESFESDHGVEYLQLSALLYKNDGSTKQTMYEDEYEDLKDSSSGLSHDPEDQNPTSTRNKNLNVFFAANNPETSKSLTTSSLPDLASNARKGSCIESLSPRSRRKNLGAYLSAQHAGTGTTSATSSLPEGLLARQSSNGWLEQRSKRNSYSSKSERRQSRNSSNPSLRRSRSDPKIPSRRSLEKLRASDPSHALPTSFENPGRSTKANATWSTRSKPLGGEKRSGSASSISSQETIEQLLSVLSAQTEAQGDRSLETDVGKTPERLNRSDAIQEIHERIDALLSVPSEAAKSRPSVLKRMSRSSENLRDIQKQGVRRSSSSEFLPLPQRMGGVATMDHQSLSERGGRYANAYFSEQRKPSNTRGFRRQGSSERLSQSLHGSRTIPLHENNAEWGQGTRRSSPSEFMDNRLLLNARAARRQLSSECLSQSLHGYPTTPMDDNKMSQGGTDNRRYSSVSEPLDQDLILNHRALCRESSSERLAQSLHGSRTTLLNEDASQTERGTRSTGLGMPDQRRTSRPRVLRRNLSSERLSQSLHGSRTTQKGIHLVRRSSASELLDRKARPRKVQSMHGSRSVGTGKNSGLSVSEHGPRRSLLTMANQKDDLSRSEHGGHVSSSRGPPVRRKSGLDELSQSMHEYRTNVILPGLGMNDEEKSDLGTDLLRKKPSFISTGLKNILLASLSKKNRKLSAN